MAELAVFFHRQAAAPGHALLRLVRHAAVDLQRDGHGVRQAVQQGPAAAQDDAVVKDIRRQLRGRTLQDRVDDLDQLL